MRPQILCVSFSDINSDSRVLRQLSILAEFGEVTTLAYGSKAAAATHHFEIDSRLPSLPQTIPGVMNLALRRYGAVMFQAPAVKQALQLVSGKSFDLIVANEARALPLAHRLADEQSSKPPVWGDMHEWAPEERAHVRSWKLLVKPFMTHICKEYIPKTAAVTAVNASIGALYDQAFGGTARIVRNAAAFKDLTPTALEPNIIRLVHSGAAVPGRNLEGMIEAALKLGDKFSLDLYLVKARDGGKYWQQLKALADGSERITFHNAVAPTELAATLNAYDVGIFSLPPQTMNHHFMLPNKFFDFVQARLALVFSPAPETSALIERFDLGLIAQDYSPEAMVAALETLSPEDVVRFKNNAHASAQALSSAEDEETERAILRELIG